MRSKSRKQPSRGVELVRPCCRECESGDLCPLVARIAQRLGPSPLVARIARRFGVSSLTNALLAEGGPDDSRLVEMLRGSTEK
jgi:hypothetical protein